MKIFNRNKFKNILIVPLAACLFFMATSADARDENGVTVTDRGTTKIYGLDIDHFSAFNPTSATYIYNEDGESAATSGEVETEDHIGTKTVSVSVPTLGSTSIDFRIEGKVANSPVWAEIYVLNVAAATTEAVIIPVNEYVKAYRIGVKVNTNGTDVIDVNTSVISKQ